jgi:hypothetical protein
VDPVVTVSRASRLIEEPLGPDTTTEYAAASVALAEGMVKTAFVAAGIGTRSRRQA